MCLCLTIAQFAFTVYSKANCSQMGMTALKGEKRLRERSDSHRCVLSLIHTASFFVRYPAFSLGEWGTARFSLLASPERGGGPRSGGGVFP